MTALEIKNTVVVDVSAYTRLVEEHTIAVEAAKEQLAENKRLRNLCAALKKDLASSEREGDELRAKLEEAENSSLEWFLETEKARDELNTLKSSLTAVTEEAPRE